MQLFFKFEPQLKRVLWGGKKIARFKRLDIPHNDVGESWEISGLTGHESIVTNGQMKGMSLRQVIALCGPQIVGQVNYGKFGDEFPLLIKIIDAHDQLSIQVHPNDDQAHSRGLTSGKSEMWYILQADPESTIISGFNRPTDRAEFEHLLGHGNIMSILATHRSHAGDVFDLPARRIHSIGAGNLLVEIQEPSDITYRVFDFNRTDTNGNKRQLHTELAADTIRFTDVVTGCNANVTSGNSVLLRSPKFRVCRQEISGSQALTLPHDSFLTATCISGYAEIAAHDGSQAITIAQGESLLIAACAKQVTITGEATLITASR